MDPSRADVTWVSVKPSEPTEMMKWDSGSCTSM